MEKRKTNMIKPFWSWNDDLEKAELERQIVSMKEHGIDGFFMHARGGLKTEYMGTEWFQMIEACLDKAEELDMQAWAYDENGWPSGFADGKVPALGLQHQQKQLKWKVYKEDLEDQSIVSEGRLLMAFERKEEGFCAVSEIKLGVYIFYYHVNPYYIDPFLQETIAKFIEYTHEKYYEYFGERFGKALQGFFIDEPQYRYSPWSFCFPAEFEKRYGYSLLHVLPYLFFCEQGYEAVRSDYWEMATELFRVNFIKQIYDWCTEHHCKLTGHMMCEQTLQAQMGSVGSVMACYEYFHEPGMDHLGRKIDSPAQPKQVGSVAAQLGKKTITETFALCGWDISLNELKWIAQWQYLNGVTSLCPHLQGYSLRGCRKRDYPPSLFHQLPWYEEIYKEFADYFTTLGSVLDSGKDIAPVLVLHPMHSAYILHKPFDDAELVEYSEKFDRLAEEFNARHILHHYGDERIMEHYGRVSLESGKPVLRVGKCAYQMVILPYVVNLTGNTTELLLEFIAAGGSVICLGQLPEYENGRKTKRLQELRDVLVTCENLQQVEAICAELCKEAVACKVYDLENNRECEKVHITLKELEGGQRLLYCINNENVQRKIRLEIARKPIKEIELAQYGSELLIVDEVLEKSDKIDGSVQKIMLDRQFHILESDDNALTLDKCTYRIDGGPWQPEMAVMNLHNKVLELQRACNRNLLGPHHKPQGESYSVGPDSFSDKHGWTDDMALPAWTDDYNFVKFGCEW